MVTVTNIRNIKEGAYDEIWAVMRSNKRLPHYAMHVPELSPSWGLFYKYQELKASGEWGKEAFASVYVPQFLMEMKSPAAQAKLKELIEKSSQGKHICIYCVCPDESICHRFVLAGILSLYTDVIGVSGNYQAYGSMYQKMLEEMPVKGKVTAAFSGPRPKKLCGYDRDLYKPFIAQLTAMLETYYANGFRRFITGGAQGFDQVAFWAAYRLKQKCPDVHVAVYVPFKGQESIWAKEGCFSQGDYQKMLTLADEVAYIQEEKPGTKQGIVHALFWRNERMVDDADTLIALCNEEDWRTAPGGTAGCMQYASRRAVPIHRIMYRTDPCLQAIGSEAI